MAKQKSISNEQFQWLIISMMILVIAGLAFFAVQDNIQLNQQARAIANLNADITHIIVRVDQRTTQPSPVLVPPMMQPPIQR